MNREIPILFKNKSECCACGACLNACPKQAISMQEDEFGFRYPVINEAECIRCGKCKRVCAYQNSKVENSPLSTYAAVARNSEMAVKSASGGIFASMAKCVIDQGGVAFGAELQGDFSVQHTAIVSEAEIIRLQGSKYTQSSTERTFAEVKDYLNQGRMVLYSGTPCQIDGLKSFLGNNYDNLITVDIICHGVPNNKMFQDYISLLEQQNGGHAKNFTFRDKSIGWGINGSMEINGKKIKMWQSASSYLFYFMQGWIYRENCYKCKYACNNRPGDLTIGDYWGIEKQHPEYLGKSSWDESKGISVIIANTEAGKKFIEKVDKYIELKTSDFKKAAAGNAQLQRPSEPGQREEILDLYKNGGWKALDERFRKKIGWRYYKSQIKNLIPTGVKRWLKSRI